MKNITFLGPVGATFSHEAYNILARIYGAPKAETEESLLDCIPATKNGEILKLIAEHRGYGSIAVETLAKARVTESLESFIELLRLYESVEQCPFHVVGAIRWEIHFCFMTRKGVAIKSVNKIIAHPQSYGPCKVHVASMGVPVAEATSNGEAARLVSLGGENSFSGALGPKSAAKKYNLQIHDSAFEDQRAVTTFFLVAPKDHKVALGEKNRVLTVFKLPHRRGALAKVTDSFKKLNLINVHSLPVQGCNGPYDFVIEMDVEEKELGIFEDAKLQFQGCVEKHLTFGPFEVVSR